MKIAKQKQTKSRLKGSTLANPASIEMRYSRKLQDAMSKMRKITEREIKKLYSTQTSKEYFTQDASIASQARILLEGLMRRFDTMFEDIAKIDAPKMVNDVDKASKTSLSESMKTLSGLSINTNIMSGDLRETIKASITQNAMLIKSIPQEYLLKVSGSVMRSVTSGQGMAELLPQITKISDQSERRVKNLALDQTRKAYNSINADRMKKVGIKKFEWIHSAGGKNPRKDHIEMSGNIYSFDDLPVIVPSTGERGIPGQAIFCKCTMRPIIEFDED